MARWRERPESGLRERARSALGWDPEADPELLALAAALLGEMPDAEVLALASRYAGG